HRIIFRLEDADLLVGRRPFGGNPAHFADQVTKLGRFHEMSVARSGGRRNAFVYQRGAAGIVAGQQCKLWKLRTFRYPGDLQIRNPVIERESTDRVHLHDFGSTGSGTKPGDAFTMEHGSFFVDKTQRHEFGDSSCTFLNVTQNIEMNRLVTRRFNVTVHDSRGCRNAYLMGGLDQVNPLGGADSAWRNLVTYFVHQHLPASPRQTANAGFLKCQ